MIRSKSRKLGALIFALTSGISMSWAEPAEEAGATADTAIGEIVVTAQRRSERLKDVPISIVAQTGDQLESAGVTGVRNLNLIAPGVNVMSPQGYAYPVIRGISQAFGGPGQEQPIAIYVDGFYQPNKVANLFDLPDIDRVEVLKGPQGTLFGRNTTGGAISIHTLDPAFTTRGKATLEAGVYAGENVKTSPATAAKGYLNVPLVDGKAALSVAGYFEHTNGYLTDDRTGDRAGDVNKYITRVKLLLQPIDSLRILLGGVYGRNHDEAGGEQQVNNGQSIGAFYPGAIVPAQPWHVASENPGGSNGRLDGRTLGETLDATYDLDKWGSIKSLSGYFDTKVRAFYDLDAVYSPACYAVVACTSLDLTHQDAQAFQQELTFTSKKLGIFSFVTGLFYYHEQADGDLGNLNYALNADNYATGAPLVQLSSGRQNTNARAIFGELNVDISSRLKAILGLRYLKEQKFGFFKPDPSAAERTWPSTGPVRSNGTTPRVSFLYALSEDTNTYFTYSKGFKSPVLDFFGFSDAVAKPENLKSYEVGLKSSTRDFSYNASFFYYDFKNLQVSIYDVQHLSNILTNAGNAKLYGLDADASMRVSENWTLRVAGSWLPHANYEDYPNAGAFTPPAGAGGGVQYALDASGLRMLKAPKFSTSISNNYQRETGLGELEATAIVYYTDGWNWDIPGTFKAPSYVTVNANIGLRPTGSNFKVGLYGRNLTNKAYEAGGSASASAFQATLGPPRQVGVSVEYDFK